MKKLFILLLIFMIIITSSCFKTDTNNLIKNNIIENAIQTLKDKNIPDNNDGILFLKRYQYYLKQLIEGNAYLDWKQNNTPPIYNATVFLRMMDRNIIMKIVENTLKKKDAFDEIYGFFERAYISDVDKKIDSYLIFIPQSFNPAQKYPLIVLLHGWGDSAYIGPYSPAHLEFLKACEEKGVILVAPCGRHKLPEHSGLYINDSELDVLQVLSLVKKIYPIDEKRIYLTGLSMGGFGTYWITSRHPDMFAAIAPVCGIWSGIKNFPRVDLNKLKNTPIYLIHNDLDKTVPVSESRTAFEYLKKIGADIKYKENKIDEQDPWSYKIYGGHNAWDYAYNDATLIDWFLQYKLNQ